MSENNKVQENIIDMTSLVDVIFILLIFFILTSSPIDEKDLVKITRPKVEKVDSLDNSKEIFKVTISNDNKIYLGKKLYNKLALYHHFVPIISRLNNKNIVVIFRCDKKAESGLLIELMDMYKTLGVENILVAVQKEGK